jgi:hypothetical protein
MSLRALLERTAVRLRHAMIGTTAFVSKIVVTYAVYNDLVYRNYSSILLPMA